MESGKIVLGVIAGVALGAVLGILLAPEKGSVTRSQIMGKGEDYAAGLSKKMDDFIELVSKNYASVLNGAELLTARGKAKLDGVKKEIESPTT